MRLDAALFSISIPTPARGVTVTGEILSNFGFISIPTPARGVTSPDLNSSFATNFNSHPREGGDVTGGGVLEGVVELFQFPPPRGG